MRCNRYIVFITVCYFFFLTVQPCAGQLGISIDVKKPRQFQDRVLGYEKTDQKKFSAPRHFFQNGFTHYNYFFNANNKLNEIIDRARLAQQDDYARLLPFYDYSLDATAQDREQLDSVIYKARTGIVLHDLRNDWADNLYLLWGAAYYLRQEFDSAALMFQFINYAFAPKEKDGYYRFIGSRMDGNQANSVASPESQSLAKRLFSEPPSRNDAFIWQIRTRLAQDRLADAAVLIETLRQDPRFPGRLRNDLEEVQALYYYKQERWDSAAAHLERALDNATNRRQRTRWEYLIAQLYDRSGKADLAATWYDRVIRHTNDPVMEIYARLNAIRVNKSGGQDYIVSNIAELMKMARRDRYADYRDIIYFMAAQMELERPDSTAAAQLLVKSTSYNNGNTAQRNKAFLQLGQIALASHRYLAAHNYYDSLQLNDPGLPDPEQVSRTRELLAQVAYHLRTIDRQDSLQRIADLPEAERKDLVRKLVRRLRRAQGLREEPLAAGQGLSSSFPQDKPADLFGNPAAKGEWYFYNESVRTRGATNFKQTWGNRPNVDNWRRASAINAAANNLAGNTGGGPAGQAPDQGLTFDALYERLPLTPAQRKTSQDSIRNALYALCVLYAGQLEDCPSLLSTADSLQSRFPDFARLDEVWFYVYRCQKGSGQLARAQQIRAQLSAKYPASEYTRLAVTGRDLSPGRNNQEATRVYEAIYEQFIEGNFAEALKQKKKADSLYGTMYWTPQLLYIEAVYHVKQRDDSLAIGVLTQITSRYPGTPLAERASTLISVLGRRAVIERELENYQIRGADSSDLARPVFRQAQQAPQQPRQEVARNPVAAPADSTTQVVRRPPIKQPAVITGEQPVLHPADSLAGKAPVSINAQFSYRPSEPHYVLVILNKVDKVFRNEAQNAFSRYNHQTYYNRNFEYSGFDLDADNKALVFGPFDSAGAAAEYVRQARPIAATQIIPWLKPEKYSLTIIGAGNLAILQANLKLADYLKFIEPFRQGKF